MIRQNDLANNTFGRLRELYLLIRTEKLTFAGNRRLKIYGTLDCRSGKKMQTGNRVFFADEAEALSHGYRPCSHCMRSAYCEWKNKKHEPTNDSGKSAAL